LITFDNIEKRYVLLQILQIKYISLLLNLFNY